MPGKHNLLGRGTVKIRIQYTYLYNMHPQLWWKNHGKMLVYLYNTHLFYANTARGEEERGSSKGEQQTTWWLKQSSIHPTRPGDHPSIHVTANDLGFQELAAHMVSSISAVSCVDVRRLTALYIAACGRTVTYFALRTRARVQNESTYGAVCCVNGA